VYFNHSTFLSNFSTSETTFKGQLDFSNCNFCGKFSINNGPVTKYNFKRAREINHNNFKEAIVFKNSIFHSSFEMINKKIGVIDFENTVVNGEMNLSGVLFISPVVFSNVFIKNQLNLCDTEFEEEVKFFKTTIREIIKFNKAKFNAGMALDSSTINGVIDLSPTELCELEVCNITLYNTLIFPSKFEMKNLILDNITLYGTILFSSSLDFQDVKRSILNQKNNSSNKMKWKAKKSGFNTLKKAFNKNEQYELEDQAYVEFKRAERQHKKYSYIEKSKCKIFKPIRCLYANIISGINKLALDWTGGYGTQPWKVVWTMLFTLMLFTLLFFIRVQFCGETFDLNVVGADSWWEKLGYSAYHSCITFLTVGYGDLSPDLAWTRFFSIIDGFLGLFLMAYLTISFSRKVLR
jgi:hypothetical protein